LAKRWRDWAGRGDGRDRPGFADEVARLQASGALGDAGRLRELFDYLAARGPEASPATQAEIADAVFGQPDTEGDDATARVYVHRLRKRLEDFYAAGGEGNRGARLVLPAGTYALRLAEPPATAENTGAAASRPARHWTVPVVIAAALALAFLAGRALTGSGDTPAVNAFWQPFLESDRPIVVVVGDYYMYGEIDPVEPEQSRLIRDFRIDSPTDLAMMQEVEPERYGTGEDVGLTYLPLSIADGLRYVMPIVASKGHAVRVVTASALDAETARESNIVYLGLVSGMGLLEDTTFDRSGFAVGESYDEIVDRASRRTYTSEEARSRTARVYYRDYGYLARFRSPGGTLVAVVAGARDTALRGLAPIATQAELPKPIADLAGDEAGFEALFQVTGQQGADLSERLLVARARR
jgi:hypothetical protein